MTASPTTKPPTIQPPETAAVETTAVETVEVDTTTVACDGGAEDARARGQISRSGHPRVYLSLGDTGQIQCPYCSRLFVLKKPNRA